MFQDDDSVNPFVDRDLEVDSLLETEDQKQIELEKFLNSQKQKDNGDYSENSNHSNLWETETQKQIQLQKFQNNGEKQRKQVNNTNDVIIFEPEILEMPNKANQNNNLSINNSSFESKTEKPILGQNITPKTPESLKEYAPRIKNLIASYDRRIKALEAHKWVFFPKIQNERIDKLSGKKNFWTDFLKNTKDRNDQDILSTLDRLQEQYKLTGAFSFSISSKSVDLIEEIKANLKNPGIISNNITLNS